MSFPGVVRLHGVRVAVVVIVIYALFLLVVPQSSPQAIDAMLAWASHPTYVFSSVASAVLLALVVHDSALLLVAPAERIDVAASGQQSRSASSEHAAMLVVGVVLIITLVLLAVFSYVALYGVVFAVLLLALLAMTHRFPSGARKRDALDASRRLQVAAWLRLIAEIPLVLFAAAVTLALVEAVVGGDAGGTAWLLLALVLAVGALALLERGERDDPYDAEKPAPVFDRPALLQTQWWASVFATVALADRYPQHAQRVGIAGVALVTGICFLGLHLWMRQRWPVSASRTRTWLILRYLGFVPLVALPLGELAGWPGIGLLLSIAVIVIAIVSRVVGHTPREVWQALLESARGRGLGLPVARGAGIALLLGAVLDVERTASIVGTIAAVNIAAAAVIATLHSLVARFDCWSFSETDVTRRLRIANKGVPILLFLTAWADRSARLPARGVAPAAGDGCERLAPAPDRRHRERLSRAPCERRVGVEPAAGFPDRERRRRRAGELLDGDPARLRRGCARAAQGARRHPVRARPRRIGAGADRACARDPGREWRLRRRRGSGPVRVRAASPGGSRGLPRNWAEDVAGYDMLRAPTTWGVTHDLVAGLFGVHAPDEHCLRVENGRRADDSMECRLVAALTRDRGNVLADSVAGAGGRERLPEVPLRSVMPTQATTSRRTSTMPRSPVESHGSSSARSSSRSTSPTTPRSPELRHDALRARLHPPSGGASSRPRRHPAAITATFR